MFFPKVHEIDVARLPNRDVLIKISELDLCTHSKDDLTQRAFYWIATAFDLGKIWSLKGVGTTNVITAFLRCRWSHSLEACVSLWFLICYLPSLAPLKSKGNSHKDCVGG